MTTYLRAITLLVTWMLWPLCTWAASVTLGTTLGSVPLNAWVAVFLLSSVSGLLALLQRANAAMTIESQIAALQRGGMPASDEIGKLHLQLARVQLPGGWRVFVTWHMAGSLVMGALAFLVLEATEQNDFVEAVLIALCSYGGAVMVDRLSTAVQDRAVRLASKE